MISSLDDVAELATSFLSAVMLGGGKKLRSSPLQSCEALVRMADDEDAPPIGHGHKNAEEVRALQRALKLAGYDLGKYGPAHDGVDGDFGKATVAAVTRFQKEVLPAVVQKDPGRYQGMRPEPVAPGRVDWLTLMALDAYADGREEQPADGPARTWAQLREQIAESTAPASLPGAFVFDAQQRQLSLRFGLRMYQALLRWLWTRRPDGAYQGVGYSTTVAGDYGTHIPRAAAPEWPDLTGLVKPDSTVQLGGRSVPVYRFGAMWKGTGFTNCTNSQCAAFYVATGGEGFSVRGPDGKVTAYDFSRDEPKIPTRTSPQGKVALRGAPTVFQQTFVTGSRYYDAGGACFWRDGCEGSGSAVTSLSLGEVVSRFTRDPTALLGMRAGDVANYPSHAFMIGDVRYGIWTSDGAGGQRPDFICDQSSFIDSAAGLILPIGAREARQVVGRAPMTSADCDWIIANEAAFEDRIRQFLASGSVWIDGRARTATRIQVVCVRVFSANGDRDTVHGAKRGTTSLEGWRGVTRPWFNIDRPIAWARFYGPG